MTSDPTWWFSIEALTVVAGMTGAEALCRYAQVMQGLRAMLGADLLNSDTT